MAEFGLSYGTKEEFRFRMEQFMRMDEEIRRINSEQSSYIVGHN